MFDVGSKLEFYLSIESASIEDLFDQFLTEQPQKNNFEIEFHEILSQIDCDLLISTLFAVCNLSIIDNIEAVLFEDHLPSFKR